MVKSGFYTNRLNKQEMIRNFETAGFTVNVVAEDRWKSLPTPQKFMAQEFRGIDPDELLTKSFTVILHTV